MATEPKTPEAALAVEPAVPSLLDSYFTRWYEAVFAEEGLKLASSVQVFSKQLKDDDKFMLLLEINKLVLLCYQLQTVDQSITKTRGIMAIFNQLLSFCYKLLKKLQVENHRWISDRNKDSVDCKT
ncbi:alpha-catulin-like isoform X2 [Kogia breviceps]|uniref:alpha-catulin-like isoform X2 n=1 Tax=Kogia breviceps TaxID=27615 RepID=UPI0034D2CCF2